MKKSILVGLTGIVSIFALTGCTVKTPVGTLTVDFDSSAKSENVEYTDETGKTQEINTQDLNQQIDNMLDDVDLPQGATTEDLKDFVHGTSEAIGVDKAIDGIQESLDSATQEALSENEATDGQSVDNAENDNSETTETTEENTDTENPTE